MVADTPDVRWRVTDELSICAYYLGRLDKSFRLTCELLDSSEMPHGERRRVIANRDFAADHIALTTRRYPSEVVRQLADGLEQEAPVTVTLCSRGQSERLEAVLNSFLNCCSDLQLVGRWVVCDHGLSVRGRNRVAGLYPFVEIALGADPRQQAKSPHWLSLDETRCFFVPAAYLSPAIGLLQSREADQIVYRTDLTSGNVPPLAHSRIRRSAPVESPALQATNDPAGVGAVCFDALTTLALAQRPPSPPELPEPASEPLRVRVLASWAPDDEVVRVHSMMAQQDCQWGDVMLTADDENVDYWAILNYPSSGEDTFDPGRTVVFQGEPPFAIEEWGVWSAPDPGEFLQVRSYQRYPATLDWHLGVPFAELLTREIEKTRDISVIQSGRVRDEAQVQRVRFVQYLDDVGFPLDLYGRENPLGLSFYRGSLPPRNKSAGLLPYRYTIAIENSSYPNHYTEKILDAILAETLSFYWGCTNLGEILDPETFIWIPIFDDFETCQAIIEQAIADQEWERRIEAIRSEKQRILRQVGFFPTLDRILTGARLLEDLERHPVGDDSLPTWRVIRESGRHGLVVPEGVDLQPGFMGALAEFRGHLHRVEPHYDVGFVGPGGAAAPYLLSPKGAGELLRIAAAGGVDKAGSLFMDRHHERLDVVQSRPPIVEFTA